MLYSSSDIFAIKGAPQVYFGSCLDRIITRRLDATAAPSLVGIY